MNRSTQALELFDEFIEDLRVGVTPRVYTRRAAAMGIEVEELKELLALLVWAHYLEHWARNYRRSSDGSKEDTGRATEDQESLALPPSSSVP
jgi:hypothetical protein